jgi:hypothetical protein
VFEVAEGCIIRSFVTCTLQQILLSVKEDKLGGTCNTGERRHAYKILIGNSEEKKPFGRSRRRWKDNFGLDASSSR